MARNPRRVDAQLQELYDRIPRIDCQGLCHDSCGPIGASVRERERIERTAGKELTCGARATCSMLTPERRCGVYDLRPMVCRLWGVVESLPCPYGCIPEGGHLSDAEGMRLMSEATLVGGDEGGTPVMRDIQRALEQLGRMEAEDPDAFRRYVRRAALGYTPRPTLEGRADALPVTAIERSS